MLAVVAADQNAEYGKCRNPTGAIRIWRAGRGKDMRQTIGTYDLGQLTWACALSMRRQMHLYSAHILWTRGDQPFLDNRYSRRHLIRFDGGAEVLGSSSPHVVRVPLSDPAAVDPEEAFVSSLSSCHMLWFLSIAAARKFCVDAYSDQAEGVMEKNAKGKLAMSVVTLRPVVTFSGERRPSQDEYVAMHHEAHDECFIANSVLTEVRCEPAIANAG